MTFAPPPATDAVTANAADSQNAAYFFCLEFFAELAARGLREVVCSPGYRSAPLILSAYASSMRVHVHQDERCGGFFALGLAKGQRSPTALICTSGSAAANYFPAVVEAYHDGVPLLVLSADRPPELRGRGAGQTIDQVRLYGSHVRWFADLPVPGEVPLAHARYFALRALSEADGTRSGPVHLNFPFREPIEPAWTFAEIQERAATLRGRGTKGKALGKELADERVARPEEAEELAQRIKRCERGLVAVGANNFPPGTASLILELAEVAGWPVLADAASNLRFDAAGQRNVPVEVLATGSQTPSQQETPDVANSSGTSSWPGVLATGSHLACVNSFWREHEPEVILRIGHPTASRSLREGLASFKSACKILVDPQGHWEEAEVVPDLRFESDPGALCQAVLQLLQPFKPPLPESQGEEGKDSRLSKNASVPERRSSHWLTAWQTAAGAAATAIEEVIKGFPLLEAGVAQTLGEALPSEALVYVSNSMPVRDLDAFMAVRPQPMRVLAQRGVNGIDGVVSASLGVAVGSGQPVVLYTGDLALLHDIGGLLWAARQAKDAALAASPSKPRVRRGVTREARLREPGGAFEPEPPPSPNLTVLLINNNGGGVFSMLPMVSALPRREFRRLFHTPHNTNLKRLFAGLGIRHRLVITANELKYALPQTVETPGVDILEVLVNTDVNLIEHRAVAAAVNSRVTAAFEQKFPSQPLPASST